MMILNFLSWESRSHTPSTLFGHILTPKFSIFWYHNPMPFPIPILYPMVEMRCRAGDPFPYHPWDGITRRGIVESGPTPGGGTWGCPHFSFYFLFFISSSTNERETQRKKPVLPFWGLAFWDFFSFLGHVVMSDWSNVYILIHDIPSFKNWTEWII